jgi:hypothetical protein
MKLSKKATRAIAFAEWLHLNYQPCAEPGKWYSYHPEIAGSTDEVFTTEQLYKRFKKEQTQ